jgi:hypothetical protein
LRLVVSLGLLPASVWPSRIDVSGTAITMSTVAEATR